MFALALLALLSFAALAFDGGQMLLDQRSQQDAADAAALAGARYLVDPAHPLTSVPCTSPSMATYCSSAVRAALQTALSDHYGDGSTNCANTSCAFSGANGSNVSVSLPPVAGSFVGRSGFIEVQIQTNRPSIVGAILGFFSHPVGVTATAANYNGNTLNASLLALDPSACQAAQFNGNGANAGVSVWGNIQVDSNAGMPGAPCSGNGTTDNAFSAGGNSSVTVSPGGAINVVGTAYVGGSATVAPSPTSNSPYMPDPFASIPAPAGPLPPTGAKLLQNLNALPPAGCPGSTNPATAAVPVTCTFNTAGQTWVLSPGYYPGGITVQKGTVYLLPGIYYIGGGGFSVVGTGSDSGSVFTVPASYGSLTSPTAPPFTPTSSNSACNTSPVPDPSPCGGVMIYNSQDATHPSGAGAFAAINMTGNGATLGLYPIQTAPWTGIVIFQDRTLTLGSTGSGDIQLNGNGSNLWVNGAIYAPSGYVTINGTGTIGNAVQLIANTFFITGSGSLNMPDNSGNLPQTHAAGLVE